MGDQRITALAKTLVHHSIDVRAGENVLVEAFDTSREPIVTELVREIHRIGASAFVVLQDYSVRRAMLEGASEKNLAIEAEIAVGRLGRMDCYIGLDAARNRAEMATIPTERMRLFSQAYSSPVSAAMLKTRWVQARLATLALAQSAGMGCDEFEDYYYRVATMDYEKLGQRSEPLAARMRAADKVRVMAPGTDLSVSLKGFTALVADGRRNLPDGEVASTPVRDSMEGTISFNVPSLHNGFIYNNIRLVFEKGRVVEATANDSSRFLRDIDVDANARFIGEFSFGTNPYLRKHIIDTLFDEKMTGSLHMALGCCYNFPGRDNGNYSSIHWDLVQSHLPEYGGGEVWLDGELIRKDGQFLPADLQPLNPDQY